MILTLLEVLGSNYDLKTRKSFKFCTVVLPTLKHKNNTTLPSYLYLKYNMLMSPEYCLHKVI